MRVIEIQHKHVISYLIQGTEKWILFDAGWPDSYSVFSNVLAENGIHIENIAYLVVSHFHMDHCGIAELLKDKGVVLLLHETQVDSPKSINLFFASNPNNHYRPITQGNSSIIDSSQSKALLSVLGIDGEILPTLGHSEDSISLVLDNNTAFVGDLPQYDLAEAYFDPVIMESWQCLMGKGINIVYPAHGIRYSISPEETKQ